MSDIHHTLRAAMHSNDNLVHISPLMLLLAAIFLALLFFPVLLYGPAPDPGFFYTGGRKLLQGGAYYHDIVDIKPPFIYWHYALSMQLFGESFLSVRLMDYILQLLFSTGLGIILLRISGNRWIAAIGVLLYGLVYIGLGPENTTQIESYIGIILLPAMLLHLKAHRSGDLRSYGFAGLCYGMLLLLKPTFGLIPIGAITFEFLQQNVILREAFKRSAVLFSISMIPYLIWTAYLSLSPESSLAAEAIQFINRRHIHQFLDGGGVREAIYRFMANWNSEFGIGLMVLIVLGVVWIIRREREGTQPLRSNSNIHWAQFTRLITIHLAALLLSCGVEFWFFPYHISRAMLPFTVLAGVGTYWILLFIHRRKKTSRFARFVVYSSLIPLIIYSPLAKYTIASVTSVHSFLTTGSFKEAQTASVAYFPFVRDLEELHISELFNLEDRSTASLFVISPNLGMIHGLTSTVPQHTMIHGHQLASRFTPYEWRKRFERIVNNDPPEYILIQTGDPSIGIQGVESVQEGLEINGLWHLIQRNYQQITSNSSFVLYQHKRPSDQQHRISPSH